MLNIHNIPELNYITQIVFLLFEDVSKPEKSDLRYRVHIHFSAGVRCRDELVPCSDVKKTSPELAGKPLQTHFVRLIPDNVESLGLQRRYSDHCNLDSLDMGRPKELVVRRQSDQLSHHFRLTIPIIGHSECRIKSFSETEILAARRKRLHGGRCQELQGCELAVRSKSMDMLPLTQEQLSPSSLPNKSLPINTLQVKVAPSRTRKTSQPLATFKIDEVDESLTESASGSDKTTPLKAKGSNEKLNRSAVDSLKSSSLGERGWLVCLFETWKTES